MNREQVIETLQQARLIAILRGKFDSNELEIANALVEGGVRLMEVSTISADYKQVIRRLSEAFGHRVAVGAGTVLNLRQLAEVTDAGASFIVSPNSDHEVIKETRRLGCASFPGAFTPTEILRAVESGADAVKLFPAASLGPSFVRGVRGPLPDVKLIPTGGVTQSNIAEWFNAGAWAVAVGSELVDTKTIQSTGYDALALCARSFTQAAVGGIDV